ncbi:MAG TPA: autotransporter outer membrane beta-barrel domain-containing protein [Burkholderiales bacterium]
MALICGSGLAAAFPATASNNTNTVCSSSNTTGSQQSGSQACAFDSAGLQNTFVSGSATYGTLFFGGLGSGNVGGGSGNSNTSGLGSSRFAMSTRDTGRAAAGMGSNWNAWIALSESDVGYKFQPLQSSGHVDVSLVGLDYTFANNLTAGLALSWDQSRIGTSFNSGNLNSNGYMVAPYLSWRFTPAWSLDGTLGWGHSKVSQNDNSTPGGVSGNYGDDRFIGSVSLAYTAMVQKWIFTGRGGYLASQDRYGQFTLSNGTAVSGATNNNEQVRLGGQAMYNAGAVLPYAGVYYFNYVRMPSQQAVGGSNPANDRDGFQLQLGIQFVPRGKVYGGLMVSTDLGRSEIRNNLIMGNLGIRF